MARHENQLRCLFAQYPKNPDIDLVFEVLVAQFIGDGPLVSYSPYGIVLANR